MNLLKKISVAFVALCGVVFISCSQMKDDLSDCPHELIFKFYNQTKCDANPLYPESIKELKVFVFDSNNLLVAQYNKNNVVLDANFSFTVDFTSLGEFSFVAWGSESFVNYNSDFVVGKTSRDELILTLNHAVGEVTSRPAALFFAEGRDETTQSGVVKRSMGLKDGTEINTVVFNMLEYTNRINLTINGLPTTQQYDIFITDNNDSYDYYGKIISGRLPFDYKTNIVENGGVYKANFVELKLESGRDARLVVYDKTADRVAFSCNLVDDLILNTSTGTNPFDLDCDHDFDIEMTVEYRTDTWILLFLKINEWNIVTREVEL